MSQARTLLKGFSVILKAQAMRRTSVDFHSFENKWRRLARGSSLCNVGQREEEEEED